MKTKATDRITEELTAEGYRRLTSESQFIRRLGYHDQADDLALATVRVTIEPRPVRVARLDPDGIPDQLTGEEYLPFARRTMDPTLSRRERLSMLTLGALGEFKELLAVIDQDPDTHPDRQADLEDEIGDVVWYLSLLMAELGGSWDRQDYDHSTINKLEELAKKAIYHETKEEEFRCAVKALWARLENVVYHDTPKTLDQIRAANIRKLAARYPHGFVAGGGNR
jgi:hypothetical protein